MDPISRAVSAYGDAASAAKSPRQVEYQAFARITNALTRSNRRPEDADAAAAEAAEGAAVSAGKRFAALAEALHENLRLWTIVQGDVSAQGNGLPDQLRARLFYLGEFTREHTRRILRGEADADALIEINTAVMRGLRQDRGAEPCPA